MIINFSVENFKSIKEEQTLSLLAVNSEDDHPGNIIPYEKNISLLKTAAIHGPNASGKSNVLEALKVFAAFIIKSTDLKLEQKIPYYKPYKLDKDYINKPSKFELEFIANDKTRYKYAVAFNDREIEFEKLVFYPKKQEALLFSRVKGKKIKFGSQLKGKKSNIENELLSNNLFLSKAANSNLEQLGAIYTFFLRNLNFTMDFFPVKSNTTRQLIEENNLEFKDELINFLKAVDTGIHKVGLKQSKYIDKIKKRFIFHDNVSEDIKSDILEEALFSPVTFHKYFEAGREIGEIDFDLSEESKGIRKIYELAGDIISVLKSGGILIVDELDSGLHPHLSEYIIELFNSHEKNPNNAQLVFSTHDTSLLNPKLFRRDQIWFAGRNSYGGTELYSLDEFDKDEVRKNTPFDKLYLNGRFGAIPLIDKSLF